MQQQRPDDDDNNDNEGDRREGIERNKVAKENGRSPLVFARELQLPGYVTILYVIIDYKNDSFIQ